MQRRKLHLLKVTFKVLNDPYAAIQLKSRPKNRELRPSSTVHLTIPLIKGTFQDSASKAFNQLPVNIRNFDTLTLFARETKRLLMKEAKLEYKVY